MVTIRRHLYALIVLLTFLPWFGQALPSTSPKDQTVSISPSLVLTPQYLTQIGGSAVSVALNRTAAYVGQGFSLAVFDITDPIRPQHTTTIPLHWVPQDIQLSDQFAFVAAGDLVMLDIRDPLHPIFLSSYATDQPVSSLQVIGQRAYLAKGDIEIVDLRDPRRPQRIGRYIPKAYAQYIRIVGTRAYILHSDGLDIVDLQDPSQPQLLGTFNQPDYTPRAVWVEGSFAYIASYVDLFILDVSQPSQPTLVWRYRNISNPPLSDVSFLDVQVNEGRLYTSAGGGLLIFDVRKPASASLLGRSQEPYGYGGRIQVVGERVYLADRNNGLQIFSVSDPATPVLQGGSATPFASANAATVAGSQLYVVGYGELAIFDTAGVDVPRLRSRFFIENGSHWIQVVNQRVYLSGGLGLRIIDVNDSDNPFLIADVAIPSADSVDIAGNYAYVTYRTSYYPPAGALQIIDITNPHSPIVVSNYPTRGVGEAWIVENRAYIVTHDQQTSYLEVVDISNPAAITSLGLYTDSLLGSELTIAGGRAYVMDNTGGIAIIDIHDATKPMLLGKYAGAGMGITPYRGPLPVLDNIIFVPSDKEQLTEIQMVDVSIPAHPVMRGRFSVPYFISGLQVAKEHAYITRGGMADDMLIYRLGVGEFLPIIRR